MSHVIALANFEKGCGGELLFFIGRVLMDLIICQVLIAGYGELREVHVPSEGYFFLSSYHQFRFEGVSRSDKGHLWIDSNHVLPRITFSIKHFQGG